MTKPALKRTVLGGVLADPEPELEPAALAVTLAVNVMSCPPSVSQVSYVKPPCCTTDPSSYDQLYVGGPSVQALVAKLPAFWTTIRSSASVEAVGANEGADMTVTVHWLGGTGSPTGIWPTVPAGTIRTT
jgi:hypothetical protein